MIRNEKGMTLLEAIAAMAVLSIVVIAFLNLSQSNMLASRKADHRQTALSIAEQQLNGQRAYISANFSTLTTTYPSGTLNPNPYSPSDYPSYSVYVQQQLVTSTATPGTSPFQNKNHVSLQAVIPLRDAADPTKTVSCLLTVTVYWSD